MSIVCALFGFLASDDERIIFQVAKPWARLRVDVGRDEAVHWVGVAEFGQAADGAAELNKNDRCYVDSSVRLYILRRGDGVALHGLSASFKRVPTNQIARTRPQRDRWQQSGIKVPWSRAANKVAAVNDESRC